MKRILVAHGPNLNLLGEREPEVYGTATLGEVNQQIRDFAKDMKIEDVRILQSNHEGALIDFLHENRRWADGVVINPGALTHYSYALRDAISATQLPAVEVHLSDIHSREPFRRISVIKEVCIKQITGLGPEGYLRAIEALAGNEVIEMLQQVLEVEQSKDDVLKQAVRFLKEAFPKYDWVGIYILHGEELVLHNYIGPPSPHTCIPLGSGICGAAATERQSIIVPDVQADDRYLACSIATRSEIVVPIMDENVVYGEIDIDSDQPDVFHEGDRQLLEDVAWMLLNCFTT